METPHNTDQLKCLRGDSSCEFLNEIIQLRSQVKKLTDEVRTDALTALFNFRFFSETIELEMERTRRGAQPLAMILLDVDHFKMFNDNWGHELGNRALIHIASLIKMALRKLDIACRFGGEEFVVLLPNTEIHQAVHVAERLRLMIAATPIKFDDVQSASITVSVGVDQFLNTTGDNSEAFIQRVDAWLYSAKHTGRNKVCHPHLATNKVSATLVTPDEKSALFEKHNDQEN
jgi:diguanylate cyclase (GGDEF)-like protein